MMTLDSAYDRQQFFIRGYTHMIWGNIDVLTSSFNCYLRCNVKCDSEYYLTRGVSILRPRAHWLALSEFMSPFRMTILR
jgi:hypothetical protein